LHIGLQPVGYTNLLIHQLATLDELLRGQDEIIGIFTRLDEERVSTTAWIRRVEGDVETNKSEIKSIKNKLAMDA
jgi:hypothetical protein